MKIRKKLQRLMAMALSATLCAAMLPTAAFAADTAEPSTPYLTDLAIGSDSRSSLANGILVFGMPSDDLVTGQSVTLTTSEEVTFSATSSTTGIYVDSVDDEGNATLALSAYGYTLTLPVTRDSDDSTLWTGTAGDEYTLTIGNLAAAGTMTIPAGMMIAADGTESTAQTIYVNQDSVYTWLVIADSTVATATVTYHVGDSTFTMTMPLGAPLINATPELTTGQTLTNWAADSAGTTVVDFDSTTVTGDMDLYAVIETASTDPAGDLQTQYTEDPNASLYTISDLTDWNYFVTISANFTSSQRVKLMADIDCDGATYTSLTFAGDFDGNNKTISNATFRPSGDNCGMFASIGADQIVANLTLDNITASSSSILSRATYAGPLAGSVSGSEGHRALVQNVAATNCKAVGRTVGGLIGFAFVSDVKYCSTTGCTITGTVNGGGIAGISYAAITDCYSTCSPTALDAVGGIVGKDLESGVVRYCWCTKSVVSGEQDSCTEENNVVSVTSSTSTSEFKGFDTDVWIINGGLDNTINDEAAAFDFG